MLVCVHADTHRHTHTHTRMQNGHLLNLFLLFFVLSMLVHPDKNPNDVDRAQKAFDGT